MLPQLSALSFLLGRRKPIELGRGFPLEETRFDRLDHVMSDRYLRARLNCLLVFERFSKLGGRKYCPTIKGAILFQEAEFISRLDWNLASQANEEFF